MQYGEDVWEARCFRIGPDDENWPWLVCITYNRYNLFLAREVLKTEPTSNELWNTILQAVNCSAARGVPPPKTLIAEPGLIWDSLKRQLGEIGIELAKSHHLLYPDGFPEWVDAVWQDWQTVASNSTPG